MEKIERNNIVTIASSCTSRRQNVTVVTTTPVLGLRKGVFIQKIVIGWKGLVLRENLSKK